MEGIIPLFVPFPAYGVRANAPTKIIRRWLLRDACHTGIVYRFRRYVSFQ